MTSTGSHWLKCDFHCHTCSDKKWSPKPNKLTDNEISTFAKAYIDAAKKKKLSVFALTDHFEYNKFKKFVPLYEKIQEEGNKEKILVLPGVEISFVEGKKCVHILLIFKPEMEWNRINHLMYNIYMANPPDIPKDDIPKAKESLKELQNILSSNGFNPKDYIIAFAHVSAGKNGILNDAKKEALRNLWNLDFIQIAQWSSIPKDAGTFNYRVFNNSEKKMSSKTHILSSDCRKFERLGNPNFWIKTTKNFEGIRQILNNPEGLISYSDPTRKKDHFSKISLRNKNLFENESVHFIDDEIFLNSDLIAIIGGRGAGKSLLLQSFAEIFNINPFPKDLNRFGDHINDFSIQRMMRDGNTNEVKGNESINFKYVHVFQGEFQKVCMDSNELNKKVLQLLNLHDYPSILEKNEKINDIISKYIENWDEYIDLTHKKLEKEIVAIEKERDFYLEPGLKNIVNNYTKLLTIKNKYKTLKISLEKIFEAMNLFREEIFEELFLNNFDSIINKEIFQDYERLNILFSKNELTPIFNEKLIKLLKNLEHNLKRSSIDNQNEIKKMAKEFENIYNDEVVIDSSRYTAKIEEFDHKIRSLRDKEEKKRHFEQNYKNCEYYLSKVASELLDSHNSFEKLIKNTWNELQSKIYPDKEMNELHHELISEISVKASQWFNPDFFYEEIRKYVQGSKFRGNSRNSTLQRLQNFFNVRSYVDFFKLTKGEKIISFESNGSKISLFEFLKMDDYLKIRLKKKFINFLYDPKSCSKFCKIIAVPKYNNKTASNLSAGEKGTMYLRIRLATAEFDTPLIIDQPENDLDNSYINDTLVPLFSRFRMFRQIIIATHNANLVVNTNADQVIVAHNSNEEISYKVGGIWDPMIKGKICKILEGGERAYAIRGTKYGIVDYAKLKDY